MGEAGRIGRIETHREMGGLFVVMALDHFAMAIEPGQRCAIAMRNDHLDQLPPGAETLLDQVKKLGIPSPLIADTGMISADRSAWL